MALKCFLATKGMAKVVPIFLPVLNYSPEGVQETAAAAAAAAAEPGAWKRLGSGSSARRSSWSGSACRPSSAPRGSSRRTWRNEWQCSRLPASRARLTARPWRARTRCDVYT